MDNNKFQVSKGIGLVIQGPLSSPGVSGNGQNVIFNCIENIQKLIFDYGHHFSEIVVSTWDSESPILVNKLEALGINVLTSSDPRTSGFSGFWSDNRDRQYVSSSRGIAYLKDKVEFVCKVRTDQYFNLSQFLDDFFCIHAGYKDYETVGLKSFLHGLMIESTRPYSMCDYAYVAHISVFEMFYKAQEVFSSLPFTEDLDFPEGDSIRKFLYFVLKEFSYLDNNLLLPAIPKDLSYLQLPFGKLKVPLQTLTSWQSALTCCLSVSNSEVIRGLVWRGEPVSESLFENELITCEEWKHARFSYLSYLLSLDKNLVDIKVNSRWFLSERIHSTPSFSHSLSLRRRLHRLTTKLWTKFSPFG